jgi:(p)ppGpp synthase/HD superfamily hydrolase
MIDTNTTLDERFEEALAYAARLHRRQRRKASGIPYVAHLLSVAALVLEAGGSQEEAIAGLLHDAPEDQGGEETLAEIRRRFGDHVAAIVAACSDTMTMPKPPWRQRKEAHLRHLAHASASTRLVVSADKLHNVRSILADYRRMGESVWERFRGGREGTLWYYHALVEALQSAGDGTLLQELAATVAELESLAGAVEPLA